MLNKMPRKTPNFFIKKCPACPDGTVRDSPWNGMAQCDKCKHFEQDPKRQNAIERDDPANLKFCNCDYCVKQRGGQRL